MLLITLWDNVSFRISLKAIFIKITEWCPELIFFKRYRGLSPRVSLLKGNQQQTHRPSLAVSQTLSQCLSDRCVAEKLNKSHFSSFLTTFVLKTNWHGVCCGFVWASFVFLAHIDLKRSVYIKAPKHLVLSRGRGQVDVRGLHVSSGGVLEERGGLLVKTETFTTVQWD